VKCEACKIGIPIVLIILLAFVLAYQFVDPAPPSQFRIATGREGGAYYAFAQEYQKRLAKEGFELIILPTAGSVEALQLLAAGKVEVAFVQGGTADTLQSEELSSLASLYYEPLWLFYRQAPPISYFFELAGKRVAVGEEGSGTFALTKELLQDNQITAENTSLLNISSQEAAQQLMAGEIDAAFFVVSPRASLISELLHHPEIELMTVRRALAYTSHYSFLDQVILGEGTISLQNNIPREDKTLLAVAENLVARNDMHPRFGAPLAQGGH